MNRWKLESMRSGVAEELKKAAEKLSEMYADTASTVEARTAQKALVEDVKERLEGVNAQIKAMDDDAARKLRDGEAAPDEKSAKIKSKAAIFRAALRGEAIPDAHYKALADNADTGGDKFLPKTVSTEIIAEPQVKNPLRTISRVTNIPNLEIPKIAFTLDDDAFISDGETAKEIKATGATVAFGRHKFKVFVDVSETVLQGSDANLVAEVERGLESGLAAKEKKVALAKTPKTGEEHMSFYNKTGSAYDIKEVGGATVYGAIKAAIGDLGEDYRDNARVLMRFSDYLDIVEVLANGASTLYGVQPEQIIGKPVVFCDAAEIPIVGDFSYSHFNYDLGMLYEHDKNIKTGFESFVLTAWFDHRIKLKSAFRLAVVDGAESQP